MSIRQTLALLFCGIAVLGLPSLSRGAAQLAAGAKTSAQPTATNPQQRQIQITFDPGAGGYNVTSFQLSVDFDPNVVNVAAAGDIQLMSPYTPPVTTFAATPAATTGGPFNGTGTVSDIGGRADVKDTQGGDVNIFSITFTLNAGVSLDTVMSFTLYAQPTVLPDSLTASPALALGGDFIGFTNPNNPNDNFVAGPDAIIPITITGSFNSFSAQIAAAATPLPAGAWAGLLALALLAAWGKYRGTAKLV